MSRDISAAEGDHLCMHYLMKRITDPQPLPAAWATEFGDMMDRLAEIDRLTKEFARIAVTA